MPTVLRVGRFRFFFFFSNERREPPHIHVKAASDQATFWLDPILLAANYGFAARELDEDLSVAQLLAGAEQSAIEQSASATT